VDVGSGMGLASKNAKSCHEDCGGPLLYYIDYEQSNVLGGDLSQLLVSYSRGINVEANPRVGIHPKKRNPRRNDSLKID
jgi:hypothetical protein